MRAALALGLLLWQAAAAGGPPVATPEHLQYVRTVQVQRDGVPPGGEQACTVLDGAIFPHAQASLADVRLFPAEAAGAAMHEVPYAITLSEAMSEETEPARVLNLGTGGGAGKASAIEFDLEMPARAYTEVTLDLDPAMHDFIATATVTGMDALGGQHGRSRGEGTALGAFTLFDLTAQRLSRDTTLPLVESTFRYLHVVLRVAPAPGAARGTFTPAMVEGGEVPPSREAQTVYTTVAETTSVTNSGRESQVSFRVPARVPVERATFVLAPGYKGNFNRDVRVTAIAEADEKGPEGAEQTGEDERAPLPETMSGNILRVHATEAGQAIDTEELAVPAILGANLQRAAKVDVAVENGDDQPLPIAAVRLEMRQRKLCFDTANAAAAGAGLALYYGDAELVAPVYDYERLFVAARKPVPAELGVERLNPQYKPTVEVLPFTERHPDLLWVVLICVVSALAVVALKSARNVGR